MEKDVHLNLRIWEDETNTLAYATLNLRGDRFEAVGQARRNPDDRPMPVVGEELAIARALSDLTGKVMDAAQDKIHAFLSD